MNHHNTLNHQVLVRFLKDIPNYSSTLAGFYPKHEEIPSIKNSATSRASEKITQENKLEFIKDCKENFAL